MQRAEDLHQTQPIKQNNQQGACWRLVRFFPTYCRPPAKLETAFRGATGPRVKAAPGAVAVDIMIGSTRPIISLSGTAVSRVRLGP